MDQHIIQKALLTIFMLKSIISEPIFNTNVKPWWVYRVKFTQQAHREQNFEINDGFH